MKFLRLKNQKYLMSILVSKEIKKPVSKAFWGLGFGLIHFLYRKFVPGGGYTFCIGALQARGSNIVSSDAKILYLL